MGQENQMEWNCCTSEGDTGKKQNSCKAVCAGGQEVGHYMEEEDISRFESFLRQEERSSGTMAKYMRDINAFRRWLSGSEVRKDQVAAWKESLVLKGYAPVTVNSMLSALHCFFGYMGWTECRVKFLRVQHNAFRSRARELSHQDYRKLLDTAERLGKGRTALLMETICGTGIRVSEVTYITVEAVQNRKAVISLKGKIRTILLTGKLCKKLLQYARKEKIHTGEIFRNGRGNSLSRRQIWKDMKELCKYAGVEASKVFPHNLRHLFAVTFYRICKDIVKLADTLGHSSIETTRIYLVSTGEEHVRLLERLGLVT